MNAKLKEFRWRALGVLIGFLLLGGAVLFCVPKAFAVEPPEGKIQFTEQLAEDYAREFANAANGEGSLDVGDIVKFYDENGQAVGYSINYLTAEGEYAGYIIFDSACPDLVAEYSFEKGSQSPISILIESKCYSRRITDLRPIRTDPCTYAVEDLESQKMVDIYGNVEDCRTSSRASATPVTPNWNYIFICNTGDPAYNVVRQNHFDDFMSFDESWIESETGRYACAVSALMNLAAVNDLAYTFNWSDLKGEYLSLWNATKTEVDKTEGGITYGITWDSNVGPGYVSYCAARGKSLSYNLVNYPSYNQFVSSVDNGRSSVFIARINTSSTGESIVGHSMAVQGYATLRYGANSDYLYALTVADGWYGMARYVNFYYTAYHNTAGVFFS